ncbi:MAG TPA: potassium channel family protein [Cyclobacteriaceae bacterium]|nr:potassium channel family protein [Cyclobacteriaceae bacterium]HPW60957.1 potassium channel family protein [Cyclobacteriaceae bacterium]
MKKPDHLKLIYSLASLFLFYGVIIYLLHTIESSVPGSKMISWQDGLWYVVATITTVGYGDVYPVTYWGRALGFVVMLSSLGVYGFIIGQIANFMSTLKEQRNLGLNGTDFNNHVVIIGWNDFGRSVISHLVAAGKQVAVITRERSSIDAIREFYDTDKVYTLYADYSNFELLEKANIKNASIVFVNLSDDTEKLVYVINLKKIFADLNYVVTLDNGNLKGTFQNAGVTYTICKNEISAKLMASYIFEPDVALFSEEILAYAHNDHEYDIKQMKLLAGNSFVGSYYDKAFFDLKKSCNVILIGLVKMNGTERKFIKNPDGSVKIEAGDYLVMMMDGKGKDALKKQFRIQETE